jgi:hypothetical protein
MSGTRFIEVTRSIQEEKIIKYRGTASIKLDVLHFPDSRDLDEQNIERLKRLFRGERGCRSEDLQNHIPAVIDQHQLDAALRASGITADRLLANSPGGYAEIDFPPDFRLECLHGRHRIRAAAETFPSRVKRWPVDLYLAGMVSIFLPG